MSDPEAAVPNPTEIRLKTEERALEIDFADGKSYRFAAELLRVESPSAEVQGHSPEQKKILPGKAQVGIMKVEAVGHYAVRLTFDDLHDSGIYSWDYFYDLGPRQDEVWRDYLAALDRQGLSREV
jgi:DUF971 family protein